MKKLILLFLLLLGQANALEFIITSPTNNVYHRTKASYDTNSQNFVFPAAIATTNANAKSSIVGVSNLAGSFVLPATNVTTVAVGGAANSNSIARLNGSGVFDSSMLPSSSASSSTTYLGADVPASGSFATILTVTNNQSSGTALITMQGHMEDDSASYTGVFIRGLEISLNLATTNVIGASGSRAAGGLTHTRMYNFTVARTIAATNIYVLQGAVEGAVGTVSWRNSSTATGFPLTNTTYITTTKMP